MKVVITGQAFQPYAELQAYEDEQPHLRTRAGGQDIFIGTMRDFNEDDTVHAMTLEHYPGMTEKHLDRICQEAMEKWPVLDILLIHRVGPLMPGDPIVLISVWSAHRAAAFDACRYIIEDLKSRAPFWKKETTEDGPRWVEKNTKG